jgi:hypothetical protein
MPQRGMPSMSCRPPAQRHVPTTRTDDLLHFIWERHQIFRRKRNRKPKPWTNDPILQRYRFTNVYRELDTVTIWIRRNWREPHEQDPDLWFALAVARLVNWPDTLAELGYPVPWRPDHFVAVLEDRARRSEKVYTGAYMVHADQHYQGTKAAYLAEEVLTPMWRDRQSLRLITRGTLAAAHRAVMQYRAMGSFMAGQVIADLKYVPPLQNAPDWWTWAASGPGSCRGLNRLLGRVKDAPWEEREWLRCLQELHEREIQPFIEAKGMMSMHMQDAQGCMCEIDKYLRVKLGEGKPRSRYPGLPTDSRIA